MQLEAGLGGVQLQIECSGLDGFLLFAGQAGETFGEGVGDPEVHKWSGCEPV
jgi:hypothetical protein